jgi:transposase
MWTDATRAQHCRAGDRYASDLTDAEWAVLAPLMPAARRGGRPRTTDMRAVMNAQLYLLRTGCQWRMLPKDFPPHPTVYGYFQEFVQLRIWDDIHAVLLKMLRERMQRNAEPSAAIIDSQSVRNAEKGGRGLIRSASMRPRKSRASSATSPPTRRASC